MTSFSSTKQTNSTLKNIWRIKNFTNFDGIINQLDESHNSSKVIVSVIDYPKLRNGVYKVSIDGKGDQSIEMSNCLGSYQEGFSIESTVDYQPSG